MNKYYLLFCIVFLFGCNGHNELSNKIKTRFLYHSETANNVSVAGTFNNWTGGRDTLHYDGKGNWITDLELKPGYYQYKLVVDGVWIPDPGNEWKINDGGDNFNSILKVGDPPTPQRLKNKEKFPKEKLPEPVLEKNPELVELYYAAWEMAWNKIQKGTERNGFAEYYMDEGFNELIYQWDLCFITSFAIYGRDVFPVMQSLDNFYKKQRADGYIQRVYWETDGTIAHEPTPDEPMVNPPLFAWVEWRYYQFSGDDSRFQTVLPVLKKYYNWCETNCRTDLGKGLYYISMLGSGMDNTPREGVGKAAWIDYSAQQALAADCISKIAGQSGEPGIAASFLAKSKELKEKINHYLWSEGSSFYHDLREDGRLSSTKHIGAYWTLLPEVCPEKRLPAFIQHLRNPAEFNRPHLVPTLAADMPQYDPKGHYWLGSVWAPTNYMVVQGLMANGYRSLADSVAENHLRNISDIYYNFSPATEDIAFEERYEDGYHTLWECYSPEYKKPATRWDNTFYSRQDFVGWTGLGPISMLIENILGFDVRGAENRIIWNIKREDKHGIRNIKLAGQKVSLIFKYENNIPLIDIHCEKPFELVYNFNGEYHTCMVNSDGIIKL